MKRQKYKTKNLRSTGTLLRNVWRKERQVISQWVERRRAQYRLGKTVSLWYHHDYIASCLQQTSRTSQIILERGEHVIAALAALKLIKPSNVSYSPLVSLQELGLVHSTQYLETSAHNETLSRIFALAPQSVNVDCILNAQRRAVGGTIEAAKWAIQDKRRVACNLGGGFHHAEPEIGGGFCVYNDVAVAIAVLRQGGFSAPIAIVDLDFHQGNGNLVTFADDASVLTYSLHGSVWSHIKAVSDYEILLPSGTGDDSYLETLRNSLPKMLATHQPGLIFYIAGTDILADDKLGTFALSLNGVLDRDRFVVNTARRFAPMVVTMAGGYSTHSWKATANLIRWLLTDNATLSSLPTRDIREQFNTIARSIEPWELQNEENNSLGLTEAELMTDLTGGYHHTRRILGYYSLHGIEFALERYGFLDKLREKGFSNLRVTSEVNHGERQRLLLYGQKGDDTHHLLVDLVVKRRLIPLPNHKQKVLDLLSIEWLQLQDPTASFTLRRPRLLGQEHPGLGLGSDVMEILYQACQRLELDGIVFNPSHYHIAVLAQAHCFFLDPKMQGRFDALRQLLAKYELSEATKHIKEGRIRHVGNSIVNWDLIDYIAPVSPRLQEYFSGLWYQEQVQATQRKMLHTGIELDAMSTLAKV